MELELVSVDSERPPGLTYFVTRVECPCALIPTVMHCCCVRCDATCLPLESATKSSPWRLPLLPQLDDSPVHESGPGFWRPRTWITLDVILPAWDVKVHPRQGGPR